METTRKLSRTTEYLLLAVVFVLALVPRWWCLSRNALPEGDAGNYLELGRNLALGRGYVTWAKWDFYGEPTSVVHPEGNRQPVLPLVVAATWKLGATDPLPARVTTLAFSLATIALLYSLLRRWWGPALALAGAAFAAVEPGFLWFSVRVQTEVYFTFFFLAALWAAGDFKEGKTSLFRPLAVGVLLSLAYLTRVNGVLLFAAYILAVLFVYRGRGVLSALAAAVAFGAVAAPWWIRNARVFGDPFYSQAKYFIVAANFDDAWAVKRFVPTWTGFFTTYGVGGLAARFLRGLWRAVEPFFLGNLHFNEPYQGAPLAAFVAFALFAGKLLKGRRVLLVPGMALAFHLAAFAFYGQGLYRYFLPFYLLFIPVGVAGAWAAATAVWPNSRRPALVLAALLALPLFRPLVKTLTYDDRPAYRDIRAVATWLKNNTQPGDVVVTWPRVIGLLYDYDRPSLYWPAGPWELVTWTLANYDVKYVVMDPVALEARPELSRLWHLTPEGVVLLPPLERPGGNLVVRSDYGTAVFEQVYAAGGKLVVYRVDKKKLQKYVYAVYIEKR